MTDRVLVLTFDGPEPLLEQARHLERGALYIPVPDPAPEAPGAVTLCIETPSGETVTLEGQILQVFPGSGMAVAVSASQISATLSDAFASAQSAGTGGGSLRVEWERRASVDSMSTEEPGPSADPAQDESATTAGSGTLFDRIRAMTTAEKRQLALHGTRGERLILLKDTNKTLQPFLLKNPRITIDEIRAMAGNRQASPEALKMIAENRHWMQSLGVVSVLARNPKTPSTLAVRLLDRLPLSEVRQMAKSSNTPTAVAQAAKKKILK